MRPQDTLSLLTVLAVIVLLGLSATLEAAPKKKGDNGYGGHRPQARQEAERRQANQNQQQRQAPSNNQRQTQQRQAQGNPSQQRQQAQAQREAQQQRQVQQRQAQQQRQQQAQAAKWAAEHDRRVSVQTKVNRPADGPDSRVWTRQVLRNDDQGRQIELQRQITRVEGEPVRDVHDRTVTRTQSVGDSRLRTITTHRQIATVDGVEADRSFDRTVVTTKKPQPARHVAPAHYSHGHARHVCGSGCSFYHPIYVRPIYIRPPYAHGHAHHVCHSACSHYKSSGFSFSFGYSDGGTSAHVYYGQSRGYTPCGRCGYGFYDRIYIPGRYVTCYDACGRPYYRYTPGYYTTRWVEHTCH